MLQPLEGGNRAPGNVYLVDVKDAGKTLIKVVL